MDLKAYYRKLREVESTIADDFVVITSHETPDGGKPGVLAEVSRRIAAKMLVEGRARLAQAEEAARLREEMAEAKRRADEIAAAKRLEIVVASPGDLKRGTKGTPCH